MGRKNKNPQLECSIATNGPPQSPVAKVCSKCKAAKPINDFYRKNNQRHESQCKECSLKAKLDERNAKRLAKKKRSKPKSRGKVLELDEFIITEQYDNSNLGVTNELARDFIESVAAMGIRLAAIEGDSGEKV